MYKTNKYHLEKINENVDYIIDQRRAQSRSFFMPAVALP